MSGRGQVAGGGVIVAVEEELGVAIVVAQQRAVVVGQHKVIEHISEERPVQGHAHVPGRRGQMRQVLRLILQDRQTLVLREHEEALVHVLGARGEDGGSGGLGPQEVRGVGGRRG